jgi:glycerol dehydrogenase-like iron-containing ADH family enzyme
MIGESGHITNLYGCGRPESGSEHIFAKELEHRVKIPHGISVAVGITLMSQLQDNYSEDIQVALREIGIMSDIDNEYDLRRSIGLSLESLLPREDRYTILNEKLLTAEISSHLTDMLYAGVQEVANEYSYH